jgi:hypothetical protein
MPNDKLNQPIAFLPSGRPAPVVLTSDEVIELLRLEGKSPERTLKFYRDERQLTGIRIGRKVRYRLADIEKFLEQKAAAE